MFSRFEHVNHLYKHKVEHDEDTHAHDDQVGDEHNTHHGRRDTRGENDRDHEAHLSHAARNYALQVHDVFINEISTLGFLSFITFLVDHYKFFYPFSSYSEAGNYGPISGHGYIVEFEAVHFSIFGAMCCYLISSSLFARQARLQLEVIDLFVASNGKPTIMHRKYLSSTCVSVDDLLVMQKV